MTSPSSRLEQVSAHLKPPTTDLSLLKGHVVLITGGAQGIGKATASLLARHGAKVFITDIDAVKADETISELASAGYEAASLTGDVLDESFAIKLVEAAVARFGRINCLINNAGFCFDSAIHKMTNAQFDVVMKVHNYAPFRLIRALSSHWMDRANLSIPKSIINVASTSGLHGMLGQINYSTAKAGVVGMTKTVAAEWGRYVVVLQSVNLKGFDNQLQMAFSTIIDIFIDIRYNVRANVVAYGWMDTRITRPPGSEGLRVDGQDIISGIPLSAKRWRDLQDIPLGRPGTVDEAAGVMLFLASPLAAYVTGACIECTGGRFM